jgi:hypothetical protein
MKNTDNNKLIAEFMGVNVITIDDIRANKNPIQSSADGYLKEDLEYHTSWDWLMPVIEETDHTSYEPIESIEDALATRSLQDTYKAVAEYVKEYHNEYHIQKP